jgi:hypothetical protein
LLEDETPVRSITRVRKEERVAEPGQYGLQFDPRRLGVQVDLKQKKNDGNGNEPVGAGLQPRAKVEKKFHV